MPHGVRESHLASCDHFSLLLVPLHANCSVRRERRSWNLDGPDVSGPGATLLIVRDIRLIRGLPALTLPWHAEVPRLRDEGGNALTVPRFNVAKPFFLKRSAFSSFVGSDENK